MLLLSLGVSLLTGVLFGLAPALHGVRQNLTESLREGARGTGLSAGGSRTRNALVIAEVALSVVLLTGAAPAIRGLVRLQRVELGFQPERVLQAGLPMAEQRYQGLESRNRFAHLLVERVRVLPRVQSLSIGNGGLPFGGARSRFTINGRSVEGGERILVALVGDGYVRTMGVPLRRGRNFTESEVGRGARVALINEAAARLWPAGQDPPWPLDSPRHALTGARS